jgi:hypothetical protein
MRIALYLLGSALFAAGTFLLLCGDWKWTICSTIGLAIILIGDEKR